jgi:hypothetical protein
MVGAAASRGAITEGLFIIQNKHQYVKEAIQDLKKELTACHSIKPKETPSELEVYHCKLKQLIYPGYIDELSRVIGYQDGQVAQLEKEAEQQMLDTLVQRAFRLVKKIDLERQLLQKIFEVDRLIKQQMLLKKDHSSPVQERQKASEITSLQESIKKAKEQVEDIKKSVKEVNGTLFNGTLAQEVFLDKLVYYNP